MRTRTVRFDRCFLTFLAALTVIAFPAISFGETPKAHDRLKQQQPASVPGDVTPSGPQQMTKDRVVKEHTATAPAPGRGVLFKPTVYQREQPFWSFGTGPSYGSVSDEVASTKNALHLEVGSFDTRGRGLPIPAALTAPDDGFTPGGHRYFLIQLSESATRDNATTALAMNRLEETGAKLVMPVPSEGYIVRLDAKSLPLVRSSSLIQFFQPYHPAYKLNPSIGMMQYPDPVRAASDLYTIMVEPFPGEREAVTAAVRAVGGSLVPNTEESGYVWADIQGPKIFDLAKFEGIRQIYEYVEPILHSEEGQMLVLTGGYIVGDQAPLYKQFVNGSGNYLHDDINNDGTINGGDVDYNGNGRADSAAQIIDVMDTGLSVDAGDMSDTRTDAGVITVTGTDNIVFGSGGTNANRHRKLAGYKNVAFIGGSGGTGDLKSCDSAGSGGFTHGQTTAGTAAGNASDVPGSGTNNGVANPTVDWDNDGVAESYGTKFTFTSGNQSFRVDGVAKGARILFLDSKAATSCPEDVNAGLQPGDLNIDLTFAHVQGARIHNLSFGVASTSPVYTGGAVQIDTFLAANLDSMVFVSAGNSGDDNSDPDPYGQTTTLGVEAQSKSAVTVGANFHQAPFARVGFSSIGPAGAAFASADSRVKPDLMAPGSDFGGVGLSADYNCRSDDDDNVSTTDIQCLQQIGYQGTSYSSPNAAGAGAIVRDYFVRGMFPDGTTTNGTNSGDRVSTVSGALVKAILIASADPMTGNKFGANNIRYEHRFNSEVGYGGINLSNALPDANDPTTPFGMIIDDNGTATAGTIHNLNFPATLADQQRFSATFQVVDSLQPLTCAVAWVDTATSALSNDLVLELTNPGADGTLNNADDVHYYGNVFTEDFNDDGTIDVDCDIAGDGTPNEPCDYDKDGSLDNATRTLGVCRSCVEDLDLDGTPSDSGSSSLPLTGLCDQGNDGTLAGGQCRFKPIDIKNTNEAIYLVPDPAGDGQTTGHTNDNQIRTGTWAVAVGHTDTTGAQRYALVCTGGITRQSSVRLDTNPLKCNGDVDVNVTEMEEAVPANDPCCTNSSCSADTCVEARTRIEVRNAVFLTDCIDNDNDGTRDEGGPSHSCPGSPAPSTVKDVDADEDGTKDSGEDLVDLERGNGSTDPNGYGSFDLVRQGAGLGFATDVRIPASASVGRQFRFGDRILAISDGYSVSAFYRDIGAGGAVNQRQSTGGVDCVANIDLFPIGQTGRNVSFLMTGGCDDDRFFDDGERFTYEVQLGNLDGQTLRNAEVSLRARVPIELDGCDNDNDGTVDENDGSEQTADPCRTVCQAGATYTGCNPTDHCDFTGLTVVTASQEVTGGGGGGGSSTDISGGGSGLTTVDIGEFQPNFLKNVSFAVSVNDSDTNANFPKQVEMVVGLKAIPAGRTVESCKVFRHVMDADDDALQYSTDYPTLTTVDRDINADEKISNPISDPFNPYPNGGARDNYDKLNETITFQDMQTTSFGRTGQSAGNPGFQGPWDFDGSNEGFTSGLYEGSTHGLGDITNWGEDHNFNNILDGPQFCQGGGSNGSPCSCSPGNPPCTGSCGTGTCRAQEDIDGDSDGSLDQNWSVGGGCGWASRGALAKGGIWHTGTTNAPGGTCTGTADSGAFACEYMDVEDGVFAQKLWVEFLATPIVKKVHLRPDGNLCSPDTKDNDGDGACNYTGANANKGLQCSTTADCPAGTGVVCQRVNEDDDGDGTCDEGFDYRVQLERWAWNFNADLENDDNAITWEPDMDTNSLDPVDVSDGFITRLYDEGMGPLHGKNVNLINGFPMFVGNDEQGAGAKNGISDTNNDGTIDSDTARDGTIDATGAGNRLSDRSCVFDTLPNPNREPEFRLRDPEPADDDCDSDIVSYGADGAPGIRGIDDDGDSLVDERDEACACFKVPDGQDDDSDGIVDDVDELVNFWHCSNNLLKPCKVDGDCSGGTCRRYGKPFGTDLNSDGTVDAAYDDQCGDGTVDENITGAFAAGTVNGEAAHKLSQNNNFNLGTVNGPFLRFQTIEDFYDAESGNGMQAAVGIVNFEGLLSAPNASTYGLAIDDMVWEWSETHPKNQTPNNKCTGAADGGGTDGGSGAGAGSLGTDGSGTDDVVAQCGSIALGSDLLFESSIGIPTQVVDGNANSGSCTGAGTINTTTCTQGTIDCSRYGLGATFSNDCDGDGFFEVEIQGFNLEEPEGEFFRLEQVSASSAIYIGTVPVSSTLNAKRDGVMFTQWRGVIVPQLTVRYIDKYDGIHPFNNGTDGKPGIALVDDDRDSLGPDKKPGRADVDDDGTGQCDATSSNAGSTCNADAGCAGSTRVGRCILVDDARESCRDRDGNGLLTNDRAFGDDDNGDGTCGQLTDEADELCPSGGVKTTFSDDNCGCTINPREYVTIQLYQDADIAYAFNRVNEKTGTGGDVDGFADSREVMLMTMTVRNFSSNPIEDLTLRLSTRDDDIACITDDTSFIGNVGEKGGNSNASFATTPQSDRFEFYVANVSRTSMEQSLSALFYMTATGTLIADDGTRTPFFGTTSPQSFSMDLDIDASLASITSLRATDKRTIGFNTNIGPGDQYATPAAFYSAWTASSFPNRPGLHCQYNDPTNPFVTSTAPPNCFLQQDTGTIVVDNDRDNVPDAGNSDWHLHRNASRANGIRGHDTSVTNVAEQVMHLGFHDRNGATCTGCQNSGVAADVPLAKGSLAGNDWDTVHLDNIMQVYYNTPFRLGLARGDYDTGTAGVEEDRATLSFWHMMALPDDRMFGLSPPQSFDGGAVYVLIDRDDDGTPEPGSPTDTTRDGFWKRINPYYGIPTQQPQAFGNCRYDPDDEGSTEKDIAPGEFIFGPSTTCFPEIVWACVGDTQNDDTYNGLFGEVPTGDWCYIENPSRIKGLAAGLINGGSLNIDEDHDGTTNSYDATGGIAGCTGGNCQGFGNWVETKFDLGEFRGRSVFIRFLVSTGQFGLNNWIEAFDPLNDNTFTGNRDDGWYIDDIVLTGLQSSGSTFRLKPDADSPPANSCPASFCSSNPTANLYVGTYPVRSDVADNDVNGKTDENDEVKNGDTNTDSDAPGRLVDLVATKRSATLPGSSVTLCIGGQLEYQFEGSDLEQPGYVVAPFSTTGTQTDDPESNTLYTMTTRCSSVRTCSATDTATVCVNGSSNFENRLTGVRTGASPGGTGATFSWSNVCATQVDFLKGELSDQADGIPGPSPSAGQLAASVKSCILSGSTATSSPDGTIPLSGQGLWYLLRYSNTASGNGTYNDGPVGGVDGLQYTRDGITTCP